MPSPSVTYSFSNSTTADATQVNQNFTDLINGVSDGTKDLSISALTCAGNVTLNGNVTLGNASGDDVTITGSLAATINIKTTNTYNIGSSTKGLAGIYFGQGGGANTARIVAPTLASDITNTLPGYTGTLRNIPAIASSKTTTYPIVASDEFIPCSASGGSFTVTLPTAVGVSGKVYTIKRTDQTLANAVTVATTSSQTIDGVTTTTLNTQYETLTVVSDGSNWHVLDRRIDMRWTSFTPTGSFVSNTTYTGYWRRQGPDLEMIAHLVFSGAPTSTTCTINLPTGLAMDTTVLLTTSQRQTLGHGVLSDDSGDSYQVMVRYNGSGSVMVLSLETDAGATDIRMNGVTQAQPITIASPDFINVKFKCPISGWNG